MAVWYNNKSFKTKMRSPCQTDGSGHKTRPVLSSEQTCVTALAEDAAPKKNIPK